MDDYTVESKQWLKGVLIFAVVVLIALGMLIGMSKNIILQIEGDTREFSSYASTVEEFLNAEGVQLESKGYINYPLDTKLENNMHLVIKGPKNYTIEIGKEVHEDLISPHDTVQLVLQDLDFELGSLDYTEPELDSKIKDGDKIKLFKVKEVVEDIEKVIPYEEIVKNSKDLDKGVTRVVQKGKNGKKIEKIKQKFINGELVSTDTIEEKIIETPVTEMAERGTRQLVATTRGSRNFKKSITMNASAYDLSYRSTGKRPGDRYYGITASGTRARPGVVAVDPRVIPLGTKLYVESLDGTKDYGFATAEDTGGAIKGNKIDLFFETRNQVRSFGRRNVKVYILD